MKNEDKTLIYKMNKSRKLGDNPLGAREDVIE